MTKLILAVVLAVGVAGLGVAQQAEELESRTRFGTLRLDEKGRVVFRGHPLDPEIRVNSAMDFSEAYRFGDTDVVVVTEIGGTACPYLYYFVSVTKSAVKATSAVGTCNEAILIERRGNSIAITMHGFLGPFEPEGPRKKAFRETHVFIFRDGVVTDNGKLVR